MGARRPHVGFFDSGRFCIHGGYLGSRVDDLWCITPEASESWTEITTIGAKPSARRLHGGSAGSRVDDLWCITPEAVTCASTTHDCQDGFERDTDKDGTACAADACTDTECCKAVTCASTTHDCQDGFEPDTDKDGTACVADACTDSECCKAVTCASTTHDCQDGF